MIYVTGDTHGSLDMAKLFPKHWVEGQSLSRDDYLIQLGDFGAIWGDGPENVNLSARDHQLLSWYEHQPWTTLFVDGNHENHDLIDTFEVSELFGGKVQVVPGYPHVIHLMRGEVFDIPSGGDGTVRCLVMGGADSMDKEWRVEGESWWAREMPSNAEYDNCTSNLERVGCSVDYVFTHDVPYKAVVDALSWNYAVQWSDPKINELTGFLQWLDERLDKTRLKGWYAGHYHVDKTVMDDVHQVLYQEILPLGEFTA